MGMNDPPSDSSAAKNCILDSHYLSEGLQAKAIRGLTAARVVTAEATAARDEPFQTDICVHIR